MATARRRHHWQQTAEILTTLHNTHCSEKHQLIMDSSVFMPDDLKPPGHHTGKPKAQPATKADCEMLANLFPGDKKKRKVTP